MALGAYPETHPRGDTHYSRVPVLPFGSVMRLRRQACANAQRFRAEKAQRALSEPKAIGEPGI